MRWLGLTLFVAAALGVACGQDTTLTKGATASPLPSVAQTVTPKPCSTSVVSPPPNVDANTLDCGNANYAVASQDTFDGDNDVFTCVWTCTAEDYNPTPHEELQTWNITAGDDDFNSMIAGPIDMPCCEWVP